jgi:class 3 adenylate cyclase
MDGLAEWLEKLGMSEYAQRFAKNAIDFSVLPDLTDQDLKELSILLGDRRKMLRAIAALKGAPTTVAPPAPAVPPRPETAPIEPISGADGVGERRHLTVMFCDLIDPTGITARLDAEERRDLVEAYLDTASAAVTEMGGHVAKKLDDCLLAQFGYPVAHENDAERAVQAALALHGALAELTRSSTGKPAFAARIAIDSGPAVLDAVGQILGEVPNIVAQAPALVEPGAVVVTARVQRRLVGLFVANERGSHQLKGVREAVTLYTIVGATGGRPPKPNYYQLITRAMNGIDSSSVEARQEVYERSRAGLVARLRFNQPGLSKAEIAKERLALEEAIRRVEAEGGRKSRTEIPREPPRSPAPLAGAPDSGAQSASGLRQNRANPSATNNPWAGWPTKEVADPREESARPPPNGQGAKGVQDVRDPDAGMTKPAKSVRRNRDAYEEEASPEDFEQHLESEDLYSIDDEKGQDWVERVYEPDEEQPRALPLARHKPRSMTPADDHEQRRRSFSYGGWVRLLAVLTIFAGVVGMTTWQWATIAEFHQFIHETGWTPQANRKTPSAQSKFAGRIPQQQGTGQEPGAGTPGAKTASAVAQQVVLHEEGKNDQQGRRYVGSVIWRTATASRGAGLPPEIAVLADAEIPERRMTATWSLRRNTDKTLPASHTIEIKFNVPADFPGGGIANVSGILMAQADQVRGSPLSGVAAKMTDGFFVIGLSALDLDLQLNEQLLKDRSWVYIPIGYTNGGRAILAMEKGPPGDRAFTEALAAREKK